MNIPKSSNNLIWGALHFQNQYDMFQLQLVTSVTNRFDFWSTDWGLMDSVHDLRPRVLCPERYNVQKTKLDVTSYQWKCADVGQQQLERNSNLMWLN